MSGNLELDVRHLPPPEPFERALIGLRRLAPGATLTLRIHREPVPLYQVLAERGFDWQAVQRDDDDYEIRIWRAATPEA
jgi:uncharacterized protein (DUF2249 family)